MVKKILFCIANLDSGGQERRLLELLYYLNQKKNYRVHLLLLENVIHYDYVREMGIPITIIERQWTKKDPVLFWRFYSFIKQLKPDIIHTWGVMATFYSIPSKLILRIPLVSNLIANAKNNYGTLSLNNFLFKADCHFSDIILSNSLVGLKAYGVDLTKSQVIYNGVRLERFKFELNIKKVREKLGVTTPFTIIMVASFTSSKDYDLFLDVAKTLAKHRKDITFVGVGSGVEWKRIQLRLKNENIENVILTGIRNDVEILIAASNIGVLFTQSEGISNAIIEYMALGKPVITTDLHGGSKELIINGETGFIVENNCKNIAKLVEKILETPLDCTSLGEKGKERVEELFSIEHMGSRYIEIYNQI